MIINILTKNPGKILVAKNVFDEYNIETNFIDKEYPEIQADTSLEIARFTAKQAAKDLNLPIIREDHSLFINALGFPGPYTSYIEKRLPAKKLLEIMKNETDRSGYFEISTVFSEPDGSTKEYVFKVPINIANKEKGDLQGGWNTILKLQNEKRTFAEYLEKERLSVWNKNYKAIAEWLVSGNR